MTTTTKPENLVFTEPMTYIATPCPEWCTGRLMHPCENDYGDGRESRYHTGPRFGEYLRADGEEFTDAPGQVKVTVELYVDDNGGTLDPASLRQLSADTLAAAEWLEAHQ